VSRRLIRGTLTPDPGLIQTPADDLESFSWLLLWVVLKKLEQKMIRDGKSTLPPDGVEMRMLRGLGTNDLVQLRPFKAYLVLDEIPSLLEEKPQSTDLLCSYLGPFAKLLTDWFSLAVEMQKFQQELLAQKYSSPQEKMKACLHLLYAGYDQFFEIGVQRLPMLSDAWP
jgi:hypothetical protein